MTLRPAETVQMRGASGRMHTLQKIVLTEGEQALSHDGQESFRCDPVRRGERVAVLAPVTRTLVAGTRAEVDDEIARRGLTERRRPRYDDAVSERDD